MSFTNLGKFKEQKDFVARFALFTASFGGTGLLFKRASGTVGSFFASLVVWAICYYQMNFGQGGLGGKQLIDPMIFGHLTVYSFIIGWLSIIVYERFWKDHDPGYIVIDEAAAIFLVNWIILLSLDGSPLLTNYYEVIIFINFVVFRVFDILKPFPINFLDKKLQNAFGVMIDDIIAGLMSIALVFLGLTAYGLFLTK